MNKTPRNTTSERSSHNSTVGSQTPLVSSKKKARSRSISPTLSQIGSNIASSSKGCISRTLCKSRDAISLKTLEESILATPEKKKLARDSFHDKKNAHYRDYMRHSSDAYKTFRRQINDERNLDAKHHKDDVAERDRLNYLINVVMQNNASMSECMSDEEKRQAFDGNTYTYIYIYSYLLI